MSGTTSALFHLTELLPNGNSGTQFKLTADKIVVFNDINGNTNTNITYFDHDLGTLITRNVVENAAAISILAVTTFWVTLTTGEIFYINADRLVYAGIAGAETQIFLDDESDALREYSLSTPINSIVAGSGNVEKVFLQDGSSKWINSLYIGRVTRMPNPSDGFKLRYNEQANEYVELDLVASGNGFNIGSSWV